MSTILLEDLSERDLREAPVWRVAGDGEDLEGRVEPWRVERPAIGDRPCFVAARCELADGTSCAGFVAVRRVLGAVELGPLTLFHGGRRLELEASIPGWNGTKAVTSAERALLPVRYALAVAFEGEAAPRSGAVTGSRLMQFIRSTLRGLRH